jgi:hypothetical protein
VHGRRGLGILGGAEVAPDLRAALSPKALPRRLTGADASSPPPPLPKMPPTRDAVAIRSSGLKSSGPSGLPIAAYSPGILSGLSLASAMYWLMPAM